MNIKKRDQEIWRIALTLANNICVQESDSHNADDRVDESNATAYCAKRIRDWISIDSETLQNMLNEGGFIND